MCNGLLVVFTEPVFALLPTRVPFTYSFIVVPSYVPVRNDQVFSGSTLGPWTPTSVLPINRCRAGPVPVPSAAYRAYAMSFDADPVLSFATAAAHPTSGLVRVDGFTHASTVRPVVRFRLVVPGIVTNEVVVPANFSAFP
jgi:hypothetical protein